MPRSCIFGKLLKSGSNEKAWNVLLQARMCEDPKVIEPKQT